MPQPQPGSRGWCPGGMPGLNPGQRRSEGTGARHPPCQRPGLPCALLPLAGGLGAGQRAELSSPCGTDDGHPASSFPGPPPPGGSACFLLRAPGFHCERFFGEAASLHSVLLIRFSQVPSVTGLLIFIWSTPDMIRSVGLGGWGDGGRLSFPPSPPASSHPPSLASPPLPESPPSGGSPAPVPWAPSLGAPPCPTASACKPGWRRRGSPRREKARWVCNQKKQQQSPFCGKCDGAGWFGPLPSEMGISRRIIFEAERPHGDHACLLCPGPRWGSQRGDPGSRGLEWVQGSRRPVGRGRDVSARLPALLPPTRAVPGFAETRPCC